MSDPTKHFDAPRMSSRLAGASGLARARWSVLLALAIVVAVVAALAFGVLLVDRTGRALLDSAVGATSIIVQLDARTSAVDADALGPRIKALPDVADAILTGRDEALKALVATGLPPPDGRNPLPDVWTVRLRPPSLAGDAPAWSTGVADLRRALGALPQVEATRVDERWVGTVDAAIGGWATWRGVARPLLYGLLAALGACAAFLGGRALAEANPGCPRVSVLALLATIAVAVGLLGDAIASGVTGALLQPTPGSALEVWLASTFVDLGVPILALVVAAWMVVVVATVLGGRRVDSEKTLPGVTSGHRNY